MDYSSGKKILLQWLMYIILELLPKMVKMVFLMIGYDDIYSIEYMYEKRMGYWKHDGKVTIFDAFEN